MEHVGKKWYIFFWLVVSTILKNIPQWEGLSHILWKIKLFETTNQIIYGFGGAPYPQGPPHLLTFQSLQSFLEIAKPIRVSCEKHPFSVVPMECGISLLDHGF